MRALVQRVARASVEVGGECVGEIGTGLLIFLGIKTGDTEQSAAKLAEKVVGLRIFPDEAGKMNRSLIDVDGQTLIVSQFTLYGDCSKGKRPNFTAAAPPEVALRLYQEFINEVEKTGVRVAQGRFGAHMIVSLENDGPVTLMVETD